MKKVISLILALLTVLSITIPIVNADSTIDLGKDDFNLAGKSGILTIKLDSMTSLNEPIIYDGDIIIKGSGALSCPAISATSLTIESGFLDINNGNADRVALNVNTLNLSGGVIRVQSESENFISISGNINYSSGVLLGYSKNQTAIDQSINLVDGTYWGSDDPFAVQQEANIKNKKYIIIAKNAQWLSENYEPSALDSEFVCFPDVSKCLIPLKDSIISGGSYIFSTGTVSPVRFLKNISGNGTIIGCSNQTNGINIISTEIDTAQVTLIQTNGTGTSTSVIRKYTENDTPPQPTSPTNKNFTLVGEIINQTKNSVTISYKIVNNDGIYEIMLKPIFDEQNIEVFVDKNALGSSWSDVLSKEGYAYELYCNDASTKTNTNLAIITYTNIQPEDTFGLEYSYTPDDSGSITANTNEITIQALTHQAVFHFMYNGSEIKTVTHTDVEIETTLTDLSELENNIHWFKQSRWYSDSGFTTAITYMPNNDIDVYCNYEFNVKTGDIDGNGKVTADDLTLLRRYRISDTDNFVFINDEDDAFNKYDENKHYIFLCCANVNNSADNKIDGSDVLALSWAICSGKEGSQDYSYMLSNDESSVIKRQ